MKRFFCNFAKVMYYQRLSDEEILSGFREGDADIIREYFYGYCQVGYNIFDQRYQLREKENLDFMSLAHQYALHQRVPLCGARCTEMVPQGVRQHHVRGLSDVVRRNQRPAVAVQQDGRGCM